MIDYIKETLASLKQAKLFRQLKTIDKIKYPYIYINGKQYLLFSSNDYLGLMNHPQIKKACIKAVKAYGTGSGASRLISGSYKIHKDLEKELAKLKKTESALVFSSGYQTNVAVISALAGKDDLVILDKLNHASIIDGAKLSEAYIRIYPHKNIGYLEKILQKSKSYRKKLIVTDSVFSMDGDSAPLKEISKLSKRYNAYLMVDEAHATGVFGEKGGGLTEEYNLYKEIDIQMGTFSKAFGGQGGYVAGSKELIDYLINKARGFIYSTALSPAIAASNLEAIKIITSKTELRRKLWKNIQYFKNKLFDLNINFMNSNSQIFPLIIGDEAKTIEASKNLFKEGIFAPAIRYPTVPKNQGRIRISISAFHSPKDIDYLIKIINKLKGKGYFK